MEVLKEFRPLCREQLTTMNGGGFAYDLGRAIRYLLNSGGGFTMDHAILDWTVNEAANDAVNGG